MPDHYVSVSGESKNTGAIDSPWSLDYAFRGAKNKDGIERIQPGDTVWVSGGTYRSETGFKLTVSGSAAGKITFKACPDETVILDGSIAEFTTPGNTAWVEDDTFGPDRHVYRSTENKYPAPGFAFYGGLIEIDGEWYSLAPHKSHPYLLSDTHDWDAPNPRYLGPGISQDNGYLYIRLDNSTPRAQLRRRVPQIVDPDPRNHAIYLCRSDRFGLTITGSHLVIEGFAQVDHFGGCFLMKEQDQTDITLRDCGGRPIYFGARCGFTDGLILDSCKYYAHMPSDTWWVSYADIKAVEKDEQGNIPPGEPPADHVRKAALDLGRAANVEVIDCLFDEFFDGILAAAAKIAKDGRILLPPAHDIQVHNTTFNHIWDDSWQMSGSLYQINFHHNFCYGAGPSIDNAQANLFPGTVYIHHNVIDTTTRLVFRGRYGAPGMGMDESSPLPSHISSTAFTWPRKLYYNTIVTGQVCGGPDVGWACPKGEQSQAKHEVYNNIFLVIDGRPGGRDFDATSGNEIYDGNVYWYYFALPHVIRTPWRLLHVSGKLGGTQILRNIVTVSELRASRAFEDSQAYYPPGWEHSGLSEDPQLDSAYKPRNASCQTGAVNLMGSNWPDTNRPEAWRGAVNPFV